ncbi:MAG: TadE/TadG family type IV pilus assembly protein [Pseudomonadota bacterium]
MSRPAWTYVRRALSRRRRGSVSMEAILAFPAVLILFGAVAQTMILAQHRLYLEQAAYAAARSALVHKCPDLLNPSSYKSAAAAAEAALCPQREDASKWLDAARWALVAASPSSGLGATGCPRVPAGAALVSGTSLNSSYQTAVENRICYAFTPGNVDVTVDWDRSLTGLTSDARQPIKATVTFKYPLTTPFRRFLSDDRHPDGLYYRIGTATVVLS